jgi:hypothetical protein
MRALAWFMAMVTALAFVGLALVLLSPQSHIRVPALATLVTLLAVQLAFMGGIESGCALAADRAGRPAPGALALGWIPALGGLAVLWLPTTGLQLWASLGLIIVAFAIDAWLVRRSLLPRWFMTVRAAFTALSCAALGLAIALA